MPSDTEKYLEQLKNLETLSPPKNLKKKKSLLRELNAQMNTLLEEQGNEPITIKVNNDASFEIEISNERDLGEMAALLEIFLKAANRIFRAQTIINFEPALHVKFEEKIRDRLKENERESETGRGKKRIGLPDLESEPALKARRLIQKEINSLLKKNGSPHRLLKADSKHHFSTLYIGKASTICDPRKPNLFYKTVSDFLEKDKGEKAELSPLHDEEILSLISDFVEKQRQAGSADPAEDTEREINTALKKKSMISLQVKGNSGPREIGGGWANTHLPFAQRLDNMSLTESELITFKETLKSELEKHLPSPPIPFRGLNPNRRLFYINEEEIKTLFTQWAEMQPEQDIDLNAAAASFGGTDAFELKTITENQAPIPLAQLTESASVFDATADNLARFTSILKQKIQESLQKTPSS